MNKFFEFLVWLLTFGSKQVKVTEKPKPTPPTNVAKGLLSMNLKVKDQVAKVFANPLVMGTLKGTVDIGKNFNLAFPCLLHLNSNQKFSFVLVDNGIRIDFDETCPLLEVQPVFNMQMDVDFIFVDHNHCRISLVGAPDYIINFV